MKAEMGHDAELARRGVEPKGRQIAGARCNARDKPVG
jgi:hypothetical protein